MKWGNIEAKVKIKVWVNEQSTSKVTVSEPCVNDYIGCWW